MHLTLANEGVAKGVIPVTPAKAGVQNQTKLNGFIDSRLRGNDCFKAFAIPTRSWIRLLTFFLLISACGGSPHPIASEGSSEKPREHEPALDFPFFLEGIRYHLADVRGQPVLLVLMRTSDLASQAYMPQVAAAFRKTAGQTKFLVLSIEPSEAPFVEAYATFENLPFPIGVADPMVGQGRTALGQVPAIPATYLLDESGRPTEAALGVVAAENLVAAIEQLEGR